MIETKVKYNIDVNKTKVLRTAAMPTRTAEKVPKQKVEYVNERTLKRIKRAVADIKKGKGLPPRFTTVEEGLAWLDSK